MRLRGGGGGAEIEEAEPEIAIAAGGLIKQYLQKDNYPPSIWKSESTVCFNVRILNAALFKRVTGFDPPRCPINAATYKVYGFPYFDVPGEESAIKGNFDSVKTMQALDGQWKWDIDYSVETKRKFRTLADIEAEVQESKVWSF